MFHIALHFLIPLIVVASCYKKIWQKAYCILMATMLIDLDHLFATPIYDPERCSVGFHPLHQPWFIALYIIMCLPNKTRLIGLGCVIHIGLDGIDCLV